MKKKTIACDRCGARIDHIPEKCPNCGEIIYDRMDPHIRERVERLLTSPSIDIKSLIELYLTACVGYIAAIISIVFRGPIPFFFPFIIVYMTLALFAIGAVFVTAFDKESRLKGYALHVPQLFGHALFIPFVLNGLFTPNDYSFLFLIVLVSVPLAFFVLPFFLVFIVTAFIKAILNPVSVFWLVFMSVEIIASCSLCYARVMGYI